MIMSVAGAEGGGPAHEERELREDSTRVTALPAAVPRGPPTHPPCARASRGPAVRESLQLPTYSRWGLPIPPRMPPLNHLLGL